MFFAFGTPSPFSDNSGPAAVLELQRARVFDKLAAARGETTAATDTGVDVIPRSGERRAVIGAEAVANAAALDARRTADDGEALSSSAETAPEAAAPDRNESFGPLTEEERRVVNELRARDREVRAHEQAHALVGGQYASAPSYDYQVGPDGRRYAIGGEVSIDVSAVEGDPEATIVKMEVVKAAALAPAEPSSADRRVAAIADATRTEAQADLTALRAAERRGEEVDLRL